jgi:tetratricopeptide (TPR) repeat protein
MPTEMTAAILTALWLAAALIAAAAEDSLRTVEQLIAIGQYRAALDASAKASPSPALHVLRSKAYDGLGDPKHAVEEAEAALAIDARFEAAHLQLGQIFLGHNTPQAAYEIFSEALELFPGSFFLRLGRGLALKDLQRHDDAEADLRECLRQRPDFPLAFDALATVYLHATRLDDVLSLAEAYRARNPKDYRGAYFAAAAREARKEDDAEALALAREAARLNPRFAAAHALAGKLLLKRGDAGAAIVSLEEAVRLRPNYTPALLHLGQAYQKAGREADAARAFEAFRVEKIREQKGSTSLDFRRGKR